MPVIAYWIGGSIIAGVSGLLGSVFGFAAGNGVSGLGDVVKFGVIGVVAFFAYDQLKKAKVI